MIKIFYYFFLTMLLGDNSYQYREMAERLLKPTLYESIPIVNVVRLVVFDKEIKNRYETLIEDYVDIPIKNRSIKFYHLQRFGVPDNITYFEAIQKSGEVNSVYRLMFNIFESGFANAYKVNDWNQNGGLKNLYRDY